MKNYGKVTIGFGTPEEKEIQILDYVKSQFADNRLISVAKLSDETYLLSIENPESSGRHPQSLWRLGLEGLVGVYAGIGLYFEKKGEDLEDLIKKSVDGETLNYQISENIFKANEKN